MISKEFLIEYNRDITIQRFGDKILRRAIMDQGRNVNVLMSGLDPDQKQSIISSILNQLEPADPTPNKQYMPWIVKMYGENGYGSGIEDLASTARDALEKFHKLKIHRQLQSPRNDIMRYKNVGDFLNVMDEYPDIDELSSTDDRGQAKEVYNNDQVRIIVPQDEAAAKYYGRGTRWCTAAKNNNMFDDYNNDGKLYILLPKNPEYKGEKYQIHFESEQYMNEQDDYVSASYLLNERFGDLLPFFSKYQPEIHNSIMFADDKLLKHLMDKIKTAAINLAYELLSEYEANDDDYQRYLIDNGYIYPEGHPDEGMIDWDRVHDENQDYINFSDDARELINDIKHSLNISPYDLRSEVNTGPNRFGGGPLMSIDQLPNVVTHIIQNDYSSGPRDFIDFIIDFIRNNIKVYRGGVSNEWKVYQQLGKTLEEI